MNRVEVTVAYVDRPEPDVVVLRPVTLVATERHFKGDVPPMEGTLWGVHYQLGTDEKFADWLERIDVVEEKLVPPSSATPSAPSPSSP